MNGTGTLDVYEGRGIVGCITERRQSTTMLITSTSAGVPVTLTLPTVTTITETSFALTINVSSTQPAGVNQAPAASGMGPDMATITNTAAVPDTAMVPDTVTVPATATAADAAAAPDIVLPPDTAAATTAVTTAPITTVPVTTAASNTALTSTATSNGTGQVTDTTHWTTTSRRSNVVATLSNDPSSDSLTTNTSVAPAVLATGNGGVQGTELTNPGGGVATSTKSDLKSSATVLAATDGTGGTQFLSNADGFQIGTTSSQAPNTKPPTMAAAITTLTIMVTSIMKEACTTQTSA
ncbi:hypothetical protein PFICI_05953 [Pestalotiopsis fici W106-1]|uniref:Uncharacterized protein n=1 Tax=Pestalotiopsis fici (strain W106-1 / CGMCC3.15140) TaxID=1229662 RepID=W3XF72_PESFW|nr:uncharacterized protein PFICI_05953 [Pestalotiopsis fici W106-1]ETS84077.1 hypothetical protein PFICI_05953 [Pestalotiopsis fici W106-1]